VPGGDFSGVRLATRGGSRATASWTGLADIAAGRPWTRRTRSQVASISKQFAAVVALNLVERGLLTLADPVAGVLTECPAHWQGVTVQHLLTHTSGMSHWGERPGFHSAQALAPSERLPLLLAAPLITSPGAQWCYSSPGYIVLSAVLERASQTRYSRLVVEHIVEPLALSDTTVGQAWADGAALGYKSGAPVTPWELHTMPGTGDIWSTADDIARFLTAVHRGGLLPERIQQTLHAITVDLDPGEKSGPVRVNAYGLGHFVGTVNGEFAYLHPGDNPGYLSLAAWVPATQTAAVALSNEETDDVDQAVADLLELPPDDLPVRRSEVG
jgi:CubicO group peptidase (beta-lactamase class C family)